MITMIRVMLLALFKQPTRQFKYELYQREQAKWFKRHAGVGGGPRDLDGRQKYLGKPGQKFM